jgi:hypothetical protein
VCAYPETYKTCPEDCQAPVCGDGVCVVGETAASCPKDCDSGGDPGSTCGPFSDGFSWSASYAGDLASGSAGVFLTTDGAAGAIDNTLGVMADAMLVGNPISLLDVSTKGNANGVSATGTATMTVFGQTIFFGPPVTTTSGTAAIQMPIKAWTLYTVGGDTPEYCFYGVVCVKAQAKFDLSGSLAIDLQESVSNTSLRGFIGPEGTVTATVSGAASTCIGSCTIDSATLTLKGTATLADLKLGAVTDVMSQSGSLAPGATVASQVSVEGDLAIGAGSIDVSADGCIFGVCGNFLTLNGLNWNAPINESWTTTQPTLHCL